MKTIRIGAGAGYSGDRISPAVELAEKGAIDYLVFECLAERTIAIAQQQKDKNPDAGYDALMEERLRACLPVCVERGVKIVTNMGAANPLGAMERTAAIAAELGLNGLRIAAVTGDDVLHLLEDGEYTLMETGEPLDTIRGRIISANAYLGAAPLVEALRGGADVVITGRVADPALFLAPMIHHFGWSMDDYALLGKATVLGHLLECAGQVTGGYWADPGRKDVPDPARLGFPIAEVDANAEFVVTKVEGTGGVINTATCTEQLIYELHDPAHYITPDVVADFSRVTLTQTGPDRVAVSGGTGGAPTGKYKVSVGYRDSFIGEGQISYGGTGAVERARLALDIVRDRLAAMGIVRTEERYDIIGVNSLYCEGGCRCGGGDSEPAEVRARVAVRTTSMRDAVRVANEVETLYTNGPAGGGGATKSAREVIAIQSVLIDAARVKPNIHYKTI